MFISENNLAALLGTSAAVTRGWATRGIYPSIEKNGIRGFEMESLREIEEVAMMLDSKWEEEFQVDVLRDYNSVELFAGGGGLALGMEKAGFKHVLLNEFETQACNTLRVNHPDWEIIEGDVRHIDFTPLNGKIDLLTGGFPCQAFSFAGKQGGFDDVRGTLFFELARAVKEIQPRVFMAENVKGLVSHDGGKTFKTICNVVAELGYTLVPPRILKAIMYQVPQKRERIILVGIRNDLAKEVSFKWPDPYREILTLRDAFQKSVIYDTDVPESEGAKYPVGKKAVLDLVPEGGDWRDLPEETAKQYMGGSWLLGGGKTGMARRLSLDEPSLTLTCSPAQKQTERCHPLETRPLTVREYARIQTFPDNWQFQGTMSDKYKQIGNAVPVNLAWAVGRSLMRLLNDIERFYPAETADCREAVAKIKKEQSGLITIKDRKNQISTVKERSRQLNLFDLFEEYGSQPLIENSIASDIEVQYRGNTKVLKKGTLPDGSAIIAFIKKEHRNKFETGEAIEYYTGKRFPSTIDLSRLRYFIPYIKGKGIRDIYLIRNIKIKEYTKKDKVNKDYRLSFELEYIGRLSNRYKNYTLKIWHTFSEEKITG